MEFFGGFGKVGMLVLIWRFFRGFVSFENMEKSYIIKKMEIICGIKFNWLIVDIFSYSVNYDLDVIILAYL